jgi:hypothetical protein
LNRSKRELYLNVNNPEEEVRVVPCHDDLSDIFQQLKKLSQTKVLASGSFLSIKGGNKRLNPN